MRYLSLAAFLLSLSTVEPAVGAGEVVAQLRHRLATPREERAPLDGEPFVDLPLSRAEAERIVVLLWEDHRAHLRATRSREMRRHRIELGELSMRFAERVYGDAPKEGHSLYLSMHGGGGGPPAMNDQQWKNQIRLYKPAEGIYVAPRAPTNTWDLWHQPHIDRFFDRLIENYVALRGVDPNRVYLMGYSAGGDGVYQLAPRMADRWAAAAMMAGHPNDASPLGLRNLGFAIFMGGKDAAYDRNRVAAEWEEKLASLAQGDPSGYRHRVTIYPESGHWMNGQDAVAVPWMAEQRRDPAPKKVVWRQDDVVGSRFYWLAAGDASPEPNSLITAQVDGQSIDLTSETVGAVVVRLNDELVDLDRPVRITSAGRVLHEGVAPRTIGVLAKTLAERGDPSSVYSAEIVVNLGKP